MALTWGVTGLFYINNVLVAAQRNVSLHRSKDTIETTNKDVAENKSYIPSWRGWTMDCDGLVDLADSGYIAMEAMFSAAAASSAITCKIVYPSGAVYTGSCICTSVDNDLPMDDATSFSASFQGTGALTKS